jgi:RNA polymerase sigma-70 factor (ECF subfamily)
MAHAVINEQGSAEEFAELAVSHRLRVFRFALGSLRNPDAAEDVTQDCFLRAYQAWKHFRWDCTPQTWLIGIANNLIRDARRTPRYTFRNRGQRSPSAHMDSSIPDPRSSPEKCLMAKQEVKLVWDAMAEDLSPNQRRVFFLRFMKEKNFAEIETITGIRRATIRVHLSRGARSVRLKLRH